MGQLQYFSPNQLEMVTHAVEMAEELISNHYKLSTSQLRRLNYDVKTLADLNRAEVVSEHFAQIVKYRLTKNDGLLDTESEDFYKICLQDHAILEALDTHPEIGFPGFLLYVVCHEMIHVVRFRRFLQQFDASAEEKLAEERRVHAKTREILSSVSMEGMAPVLAFYGDWHTRPPHLEGA